MTSIFKQKDEILAHIKKNSGTIGFNEDMFEILEGDLITKVGASLKAQLSPDSFVSAMERAAPINIFKKTVDKRSTLYTDDVKRNTADETNLDLIAFYEESEDIDSYFEDANKGFNAYKFTTIELFVDEERLQSRVLPSHFFLPYSDNKANPLKVTAMIKFMGRVKKKDKRGRAITVDKYWVYSDEEFMSIGSDSELFEEDMIDNDGINPYGVIPFVFISKSRYLLVPIPDKDDRAMAILVPVLLTDLNFAAKYMAHSIFFGVDLDSDNLKLSPDAFWSFKSDLDGKAPEVGTIQPSVDLDGVLKLIGEELSIWLDTKNLKTSSVGQASGGSASGIAKIIDEADTTMDRKQQIGSFRQAEKAYWRVLGRMHNVSVENGTIKNTALFNNPDSFIVKVDYSEQRVMESRMDKVTRLTQEILAGLASKKRAMKELNPRMSEGEILQEMQEIDLERTLVINDEELDIGND